MATPENIVQATAQAGAPVVNNPASEVTGQEKQRQLRAQGKFGLTPTQKAQAGAPTVVAPVSQALPATPSSMPKKDVDSKSTTFSPDPGLQLTQSYISSQQQKHAGAIPNVPSTAIPPAGTNGAMQNSQSGITTPESAGTALASAISSNAGSERAASQNAINAQNVRSSELSAQTNVDIQNAEKNAENQKAAYSAQIEQQKALESEYNAEKQRQADSAVATIQPLLDSEKAANKAAIDKANADQELALHEATVANEVAMQQSAVAFAKLGLTMSTGAIAATQQIFSEGALKIASLKADGAYKLAGLAKEMNQIEVGHQIKVNSIIDTAHDEMLAFKEKTIGKIAAIQNNIILTEKEKDSQISKLKRDYIDEKANKELKVYELTRQANSDAEKSLATLQDVLDKNRSESRSEIQRIVANGAWDKLSPLQKADYAKKSGLSLQEIEGQKTSSAYAGVMAGVSSIMPGVTLSPASAKKIYDEALARVAMGVPMAQAVAQSITNNIQNTPEYKKFQADKSALKELELQKARTDIQAKLADIQKTSAETSLVKSQSNKLGNEWTIRQDASTGDWITYNERTNEAYKVEPPVVKSPSQWASTTGKEKLDVPDNTALPSRSQCGEFANDVTGRISVNGKYPETLSERTSAFTDTEPKVGGQAFFSGPGYDKKYGHVAVVTAINSDGTVTIKESNRNGDGIVTTRTVPKTSVTGFYNETPLATKAEENGVTTSIAQWNSLPSGRNKAEGQLLQEAGFDPTISGANVSEFLPLVSGIASKYKDDPGQALAETSKMLYNRGMVDVGGVVKSFNESNSISRSQAVKALGEMGIGPSSSWNDYGSYYYEKNDDGSYTVYKSKFGGDEQVGTF